MQDLMHSAQPAGVELTVTEGASVLRYSFASPAEAAEMIDFLRPFLPDADFRVDPLRH